MRFDYMTPPPPHSSRLEPQVLSNSTRNYSPRHPSSRDLGWDCHRDGISFLFSPCRVVQRHIVNISSHHQQTNNQWSRGRGKEFIPLMATFIKLCLTCERVRKWWISILDSLESSPITIQYSSTVYSRARRLKGIEV